MRCTGLPTVAGRVRVQFNGADGSLLKLTAVITRTDGTALLDPITLDAANDADLCLPVPLPEIAALGFVVGNGATGGVPQAYTLTVTPASGGPPPAFRLAGNRPNPFNPATQVSFSLAVPGLATVEILDLLGRRVRTLRAELPAGPATVAWDGLDDAGRAVPSGAYLARLTSGGQIATCKMMLTK